MIKKTSFKFDADFSVLPQNYLLKFEGVRSDSAVNVDSCKCAHIHPLEMAGGKLYPKHKLYQNLSLSNVEQG